MATSKINNELKTKAGSCKYIYKSIFLIIDLGSEESFTMERRDYHDQCCQCALWKSPILVLGTGKIMLI